MSFVRSLANLRRRSQPSGSPEWLVVGLGNPGGQYVKTRHNIGFMCLNRIAHRAGVRFRTSSRDRSDVAEAVISGSTVLLAQPQTYMNESGVAVARMRKRLNLSPDRVLVIYDEVDLPFGAIRARVSGSAGGHRGMQSVIDSLQTTEIPRVRLGIGRGPRATKDHVLTEFAPEESRELPAICDTVADLLETVVSDGVIAAMNQFNRPAPVAGEKAKL